MDSVAVPPRYRWLKRLTAAGLVYVLVLLGVRVWWGRAAQQRFDAMVAAHHARGEPVLVEDYNFACPPPEKNAALALLSAAAEMDTMLGEEMSCLAREHQYAALAPLIEAHTEALRSVRQARALGHAHRGVAPRSPTIAMALPHLSEYRTLAKLTSAAAAYYHGVGDDAEAVACLQDTLAVAEFTSAEPASLIGCLVSIAVDSLAVRQIEQIAPTLTIGTTPAAAGRDSADVRPAARADVEAVIAALVDDEVVCERWRSGMRGERLFQVDAALVAARDHQVFDFGDGGTPLPTPVGWVLGPAFLLDAVWMAQWTDTLIVGALPASAPTTTTTPPAANVPGAGPVQIAQFLRNMLRPSLASALRHQQRAFHERRRAALALAQRLYELDHGIPPGKQDDLVPDYLPHVLQNPEYEDGRPLPLTPEPRKP